MPKLVTADLSRNQITQLGHLDDMPSLFNLDLSRNRLQTLPQEIGNLRALHTIELSNNELENLPPTFGNCRYLVVGSKLFFAVLVTQCVLIVVIMMLRRVQHADANIFPHIS